MVNSQGLTLEEFIQEFIEKNTLIRLWYKIKEGHEIVDKEKSVRMEWEWVNSYYAGAVVIGVTDIVTEEPKEAVNISIEN